jgi:hypothetical protein
MYFSAPIVYVTLYGIHDSLRFYLFEIINVTLLSLSPENNINDLIPWSRFLLDNLVFAFLVNKFSIVEPEDSLHLHKTAPLAPMLCQMNLVHSLTPSFFNIHFNIIQPSTPSLQSCFFSSGINRSYMQFLSIYPQTMLK